MAIGNYFAMTPDESSWNRPGADVDAAKADAMKRANYLSQMDQFYAQLDESVRQFDKTYALNVRAADLAEEQFEWGKSTSVAGLELQRMLGMGQLANQRMSTQTQAFSSIAGVMTNLMQLEQQQKLAEQQNLSNMLGQLLQVEAAKQKNSGSAGQSRYNAGAQLELAKGQLGIEQQRLDFAKQQYADAISDRSGQVGPTYTYGPIYSSDNPQVVARFDTDPTY